MSRPTALFYVQHLLGIGHLRRAFAIARAMQAAGLDVTLAQGGRPVAGLDRRGLRIHQLPPAEAADSSFSVLLDEAGRPIDDGWRRRRRDALLALFAATAPDLLLVEQFPFGRRAFRFELLPLLDAALARRPKPAIFGSLRDILVAKPDPKRSAGMVALAERYFDRVLVHGDPRVIRLEESFPAAAALGERLVYTGYVLDRPAAEMPQGPRGDEVLVSVGGGAVGQPLLEAALAARPLTRLAGAPWRLIAGPGLPPDRYAALGRRLPPGVALERFRTDFPALLRRCRVSVSQGGYNTVMETLQAGARAVIVPFAERAETEQTLRAERLAARGLFALVEARELSPARLAAAIDRADAGPPETLAIDLDGAAASARLLEVAARAARA